MSLAEAGHSGPWHGTTILTVWVGQSCANAGAADSKAISANPAQAAAIRFIKSSFLNRPERPYITCYTVIDKQGPLAMIPAARGVTTGKTFV